MGVAKSIAHMYTYNEYLYWYIEKGDVAKIEEILAKRPQLIEQNLTLNSKTTALSRAAYNGNFQLVKLFVQKYNANVNRVTDIGETALISAAKRNKIQILKYLIQKNANVNFVSSIGLTVIDYAILGGFYEAAQILYSANNKQLKLAEEYAIIAKQYRYRYVNYEILLEELKAEVPLQHSRDFLKKVKKVYDDPVIDPRETWKQWFKRQADFRDPPLVQRSELPPELQPQNQKFGKVKHFFGKLAMSPLTQLPNYQPQNASQFQESKNDLQMKKMSKEDAQDAQSIA